jgi:hypothetical protein
MPRTNRYCGMDQERSQAPDVGTAHAMSENGKAGMKWNVVESVVSQSSRSRQMRVVGR